MLRRVQSSELPAGNAPPVRALVVPEAPGIERMLARAAQHEAAVSALRERLHARLRFLLQDEASAPGRLDAPALRALVDCELSRLAAAASVEVRVHPEDACWLETAAALAARHELRGSLRVVSDETLSRGGCMIVSTSGDIDARLETRIERFCALLVEGCWK